MQPAQYRCDTADRFLSAPAALPPAAAAASGKKQLSPLAEKKVKKKKKPVPSIAADNADEEEQAQPALAAESASDPNLPTVGLPSLLNNTISATRAAMLAMVDGRPSLPENPVIGEAPAATEPIVTAPPRVPSRTASPASVLPASVIPGADKISTSTKSKPGKDVAGKTAMPENKTKSKESKEPKGPVVLASAVTPLVAASLAVVPPSHASESHPDLAAIPGSVDSAAVPLPSQVAAAPVVTAVTKSRPAVTKPASVAASSVDRIGASPGRTLPPLPPPAGLSRALASPQRPAPYDPPSSM